MANNATGKSFDGTVEQTIPYAPLISPNSLPQKGIPIFVNAETGEPYGFDPWNLKKEGRISKPILGVQANIGHGKTTVNKVLGYRLSTRQMDGRRVRIGLDDHRPIDGVPEYRQFCTLLGSREITLRNYRLNLLDMSLGFTYSEQLDVVKETLEFVMHRQHDIEEAEGLRYGLKKVRELFPQKAELGLLALCLRTLTDEEAARYQREYLSELASRHDGDENFRKLMEQGTAPTPGSVEAAHRLGAVIEELLDGPFGETFGGSHSLADAFRQRAVAMDYNGLSDDTVTLIQSLNWKIKTAAVNRGDHDFFPDIEFHDENYALWRNLIYARSMSKYMKRIRSTSTFLVLDTHRLADYTTVGSEGSEQYKLATNMIDDVDMWLLGGMTPKAADVAQERFELSNRERSLLVGLAAPDKIGNWLLKIGSEPPFLVRIELTDIEKSMTASDGANDRRAIDGETYEGVTTWHSNGFRTKGSGSQLVSLSSLWS